MPTNDIDAKLKVVAFYSKCLRIGQHDSTADAFIGRTKYSEDKRTQKRNVTYALLIRMSSLLSFLRSSPNELMHPR